VTIGNSPSEDGVDTSTGEGDDSVGVPQAADELFIRGARDESIPATSQEQSVRPLGATSFSAQLRQESAKLRAHPFAGGVLPAA
jgi:hypothetical protein